MEIETVEFLGDFSVMCGTQNGRPFKEPTSKYINNVGGASLLKKETLKNLNKHIHKLLMDIESRKKKRVKETTIKFKFCRVENKKFPVLLRCTIICGCGCEKITIQEIKIHKEEMK